MHRLFESDISAHKIGPRKSNMTFGKAALDLWKTHMQWAEGPKAFESGYNYLRLLFANDKHRLRYLRELFEHPERHHFAAVLTYVHVWVMSPAP